MNVYPFKKFFFLKKSFIQIYEIILIAPVYQLMLDLDLYCREGREYLKKLQVRPHSPPFNQSIYQSINQPTNQSTDDQ